MSWIQKLYDTYEACESMVGNDNEKYPLIPICHTTQKAHIEIVIDNEGNYKPGRSRVIPKDESQTLIPCTEESGSRAGQKPLCHPLCDKLQYVAGDFNRYGGIVTKGYRKKPEEPFSDYIAILSNWLSSPFNNIKVSAIKKYIEKKSVIADLINDEILIVNDNNRLLFQSNGDENNTPDIFKILPGKWNEKRQEWENWQGEAFVRWIVEKKNGPQSKVWTDDVIIKSWIDYYSSTKSKKNLCYVTGTEQYFAILHPKKIRNDGDRAKLISSNDDKGFTFRGRFNDDSGIQACTVGFEITQKAHNALSWLIRRQGYQRNDQVFVAWAISGEEIPDPMSDTFTLVGIDELPDDIPSNVYTAQDYGIKLKNKISGYNQKLKNSKGIVVMGLDSATPGRLAITFYREISGSDFLNRIENWHTTCAWFHYYRLIEVRDEKSIKKKNVRVRFEGAPSPDDIALVTHGHYENEIYKVDEKIRKSVVERLLPCIIDGQKIPRDLVISSVRKACNRIGFKRDIDWEKTLSIACALFRKYHKQEDYTMALDENRTTRDYLYGRLLALADSLEQWALFKSGDKRQTGAED